MAFVGWNSAADGSGRSFSDKGNFKATNINGEVYTLYAQWKTVDEYDVDYHFNNTVNTVRYACHESPTIEPKYSHTSNVGDDGIQIGNYDSNLSTNEVITLEGAAGLHIELTYSGESDSYDWVSLWAGAHPEYTAQNYSSGIRFGSNTTGKYGGGSGTTVSGDIAGDTVTFAFRSDSGGYGNGYGYYAVITAASGAVCEETVSGSYVEPAIVNEKFLGWTDTDGSTDAKYLNEKSVQSIIDLENPSTVTEVYAVMAKPLVVKFMPNGGTGEMEDLIIPYGEAENITASMFTKEGESFARWNTAADGSGTNYNDQQVVSANSIEGGELTLYALWGKPTVVNFSANGGVGEMQSITINYGEHKKLPANTFTRDGAIYVRWNTASNGSGSSYNDKYDYYASTNLDGDNVTMYVVWGYDTIINFLPNGGTGEMASQVITYNTKQNLSLNEFTKENNRFFHWNTYANNTGTSYEDGAEYSASNINGATINLYAIWGTNSTIVFNANGGDGSMDPQVVPYNIATALDANQFTKQNENFAWWNTAANNSGTKYMDGADYTADSINGGTINLYAIWGKKTIIEFNSNGADGGVAMSPQSVDFGTTATINTNTYTYTDKRFRGWNTQPDGTGTTYSENGGLAATKLEGETITLYAIWSSMNFPTTIPDGNESGGGGEGGGGGPTGVTIARAYEIAYTAKGKGMYQETAYGNGIYKEVKESLGDQYHGGWDVRFAMQDMTPEICASVTVMEDTYRAVDIRDNKLYWITKMRDGKCWMSQSLRLDLETTPTNVAALTHENTDLGWTNNDPTATWTPNSDTTTDLTQWNDYDTTASQSMHQYYAMSYDPGEHYYMSTGTFGYQHVDPVYDSLQDCMLSGRTKSQCTHYQVGSYYNWNAAIATNDISGYTSITGVSAPDSICPAGWRLPYSNISTTVPTEYFALYQSYDMNVFYNSSRHGWTVEPTDFSATWFAPFYYTPTGYIITSGKSVNGTTVWGGSLMYYGAQQTFFTAGINGKYLVIHYHNAEEYANTTIPNFGFNVRCVAR